MSLKVKIQSVIIPSFVFIFFPFFPLSEVTEVENDEARTQA